MSFPARLPPPLLALAALAALAALLGPGGAGCSDEHVHVFSAFRYDPAHDCLEGAAVVDVLSGPDPGSCARLRCWEDPAGEAFVTDAACDAPLDFVDHSADSQGACAKALGAYGRDDHGRCGASAGDAGS